MNSLASLIGVAGSYYLKPDMAVDVGLGISENGLRPGVRYRYLFSQSDFSPFIGVGLKQGLGTGNKDVALKDANNSNASYSIKLKPATFVDVCTGFDFQADNGFFMLGTLGWSVHLQKDSGWEFSSGTPPIDKTQKVLNVIFGSGPTLAIAFGWAFL